MCTCISDLENKLTTRMIELNSGSEVVESITIKNKSLESKSNNFKIFSPITGRFREKGRVKPFEDRVIYTFCPFCGEKY
jgi:hypothetical protein